MGDPGAQGILALPKTLVLDLGHLPGVPRQLEGLAVVSPDTIAVANDNNFDVGQLDAAGKNVGRGRRSQILLVRLPGPLPLAR
jgi:hypothetical protein